MGLYTLDVVCIFKFNKRVSNHIYVISGFQLMYRSLISGSYYLDEVRIFRCNKHVSNYI